MALGVAQAVTVPDANPGACSTPEGEKLFIPDERHHKMLDELSEDKINIQVREILSRFIVVSKESIFVSICSRFGLLKQLEEIIEQIEHIIKS